MTSFFDWLSTFDRGIVFFFQRLQRPWLDFFLAWPTHLGDTVTAFSLTAVCLIFASRSRGWIRVLAAGLAVFLTEWAADYFKKLFARPRPFLYWENVNVIFDKPTNFAFPSGHAAVAFAAAYVLAHFYPKGGRWAYGAAGLVCLTRLYVGVHYPTDLLFGAALGTSLAALSCFSLRLLGERSPS